MTTKDVAIDNYFVLDDALLRVTSLNTTKVNTSINPANLTAITVNASALLAAGFIALDNVYRCPFAHYISISLSRGDLEIGNNVRMPLPSFHRIQNIVKSLTGQSLVIDEEALRDAVLGADLASPVVTLTSRTSSGFVVGWAAVPNAVGYQVSIDGGATYGETQEALTYSKADATEGTEYELAVIAKVGEGSPYRDSYPGELTVLTLVPLSAPVLVVGDVSSTSFSVSWDAVTNADGYQVSVDDGVTYGDVQEGLVFTKSDALPSTAYTVKVKAFASVVSDYEVSPASTAEVITTLTPLSAPVLTIGTVTATSFGVSWLAIENATGYKVSIDGGVTFGDAQVGLTFDKADAVAATDYDVVVKAIAAAESIYEDSPNSSVAEITTLAE